MQLLSFAWLLCLLFARPAQAWTETTVDRVQAEVRVHADGELQVELHAMVRVRRGWLSKLEVAGLPPQLELDPERPVLLFDQDRDRTRTPGIELLAGGGLRMSFGRRREAPRPGSYVLRLPYRTHDAIQQVERTPAGSLRLRFQLPAWESGLKEAVVYIVAPAGTKLVSEDPLLEVERRTDHGGVQLTVHRAQLPRTVPLSLVLEMPESALAGAPLPASGPALRSLPAPFESTHDAGPLLVGLLCLSMLKLMLSWLRAREQSLLLRYLLPHPSALLRLLLLGAMLALALKLPITAPTPALALGVLGTLLVLERRADRAPRLGSLAAHKATPAELRGLRLTALAQGVNLPNMLDLSTPVGALVALCASGLLVQSLRVADDWTLPLTFLPLALAHLISGTAVSQPKSVARQALRLLNLRRQLGRAHTEHPDKACLPQRPELEVFMEPGSRRVGEVRLAVWREREDRSPGLIAVWIVDGEVQWLDQRQRSLCWIVEVEVGSPADDAARTALSHARTTIRGQRRSYLVPVSEPFEDLPALASWFFPNSTAAMAAPDSPTPAAQPKVAAPSAAA